MSPDDVSTDFWKAAETARQSQGVEDATMMGFPCLRYEGTFFASSERQTGDLLVKLPQPRVEALIAGREAVPFAPNGRRFREWARIPERDRRRWKRLIGEALQFAEAHAPRQRTPKR